MPRNQITALLFTTVLAFCALYVPQPLLPIFSQQFDISISQAGLLITVALLPLSVAPIVYGFILEAVPSLTVLRWAILLLTLSHIPLLWLDNFHGFLAVRLFQGLLLPAIFTALMTYLSTMSPPNLVRRHLSFYIASTILGGFLGRIIAGVAATWIHWRVGFLVVMVGLFISWLLLLRIRGQVRLNLIKPTWSMLTEVLTKPAFARIYLIIFLAFFCFASLLNILPFRLLALHDEVSTLQIASSYMGYLIGLGIAIYSVKIARVCGGEVQAVLIGLSIYAVAMLIFHIPSFSLVMLNMFVFCTGMFLVHSILSGYLNHLATERKGITNGLYVACYYMGGVLGSFLPSFLYQNFGWHWYLMLLLTLVGIAMLVALSLRRLPTCFSV